MRILFFISILIISACELSAQSPTTTKNFNWTHPEPYTVEFYNMYCGNATGAYSLNVQILGGNTFQYPVAQVITGDGHWFCALTADNSFGESAYSDEVEFSIINGEVVQAKPLPPISVTIQ